MSRSKSFGTHRSKQRQIVDALVAAILEGQLTPGEVLRQDELADRYNVSPTPVREALRELVALGFVRHEAHRGFRVSDVRLGPFSEVTQVRALVEPHATRLAAATIDEETLAELEDAHNMLSRAQSDDEILEYNARFHHTIYRSARAPFVVAVIDLTWSVFPWMLTTLVGSERQPAAVAQHVQIVDALREGDGETAASIMREHILYGALTIPHVPESGIGGADPEGSWSR
jgi:DNA-binding GntR family transcriptional regulator